MCVDGHSDLANVGNSLGSFVDSAMYKKQHKKSYIIWLWYQLKASSQSCTLLKILLNFEVLFLSYKWNMVPNTDWEQCSSHLQVINTILQANTWGHIMESKAVNNLNIGTQQKQFITL